MVMNAATYTRLLKDPKGLHDIPLQDLKLLADRYPYAVGVQQLLLKKYQLKDENSYSAHLPLVALMSRDRKKLHAWVQTELVKTETEPVDMPHQVEEVLDDVVEEPSKQELETTRDILHIDEEVKEVAPEPEEVVIAEEQPVEVTPVANAIIEVAEEEITETEDEDQEAEELIDNYEQQVRPLGIPVIPLQQLADIAKSIDNGPEEEADELVEPETNITEEQPKSFGDWLKAMKGEAQSIEPEPSKGIEADDEKDELDDIIRGGSYEAELMMAAQQAETIEQAKSTTEVDEDAMDDEEVAIDLKAKDSVKEHDENITETLAKIYELQKKYSKALDAYEKLIVKYPEKADYFRERIKLIENK